MKAVAELVPEVFMAAFSMFLRNPVLQLLPWGRPKRVFQMVLDIGRSDPKWDDRKIHEALELAIRGLKRWQKREITLAEVPRLSGTFRESLKVGLMGESLGVLSEGPEWQDQLKYWGLQSPSVNEGLVNLLDDRLYRIPTIWTMILTRGQWHLHKVQEVPSFFQRVGIEIFSFRHL